MDSWFELWSTDSGNIVSDFDDQKSALRFVRASVGSFGPEAIASLVLVKESSESDEPEVIALGDDLIELAWQHRQSNKGVALSSTSQVVIRHVSRAIVDPVTIAVRLNKVGGVVTHSTARSPRTSSGELTILGSV